MCWVLSQPLDEQNMVSVHQALTVQEGSSDLANLRQIMIFFLFPLSYSPT